MTSKTLIKHLENKDHQKRLRTFEQASWLVLAITFIYFLI